MSRTAPLYLSIARELRSRIEAGALAPGSRLPTIRAEAARRGVTRVTVQKAYDWLRERGWIESTVGRGTFVCAQLPHQPPPGAGSPSDAGDVLEHMQWAAQRPGVTSLALAEGDLAFSPTQEFARVLARLANRSDTLLGYSLPQGDYLLRQQAARLLEARRGLSVEPDDILLTGGASGGLALVTDYLCQPGDAVIVQDPTYVGALSLFSTRRLRVLALPTCGGSVDLERLSRLLQRERPRFLYVMPTYHNPTGGCLSPRTIDAIAELSRQHDLPVLEDDTFGLLPHDGPGPAAAWERLRPRPLYVGGLSKALFPGLRIGWLIPSPDLKRGLLDFQRASILCGPSLLQRAAAHFLEEGGLETHLDRVLPIYRRRRDALVEAVRSSFPSAFQCSAPAGGYCCWVSSGERLSEAALQRRALEHRIAFAPGSAFRIESSTGLEFRLCYGALSRRRLREAAETLGKILRGLPAAEESRGRSRPVLV